MKRISLALILGIFLSGCGPDSEAMERSEDLSADEAAALELAEPDADAASPALEDRSASPTPSAPSQPPAPARLIPVETVLVFEVVEEISTESHEEGDTFRLRLVDGASGTGGAYLSGGEEARAEVTESRESPSSDEPAVLDIRLRTIRVGGSDLPLRAVLEGAEIQSDTRDSTRRTAATILGGAAAGAVVGQILGGDTRSTVGVAAIGAIAGTGIALANRDGHAVLPEGSLLTVRLTDPIVIP